MSSDGSQWEIVTPRRVGLREVWKDERRDFSRWVKANAEFLNDHLGVTIDPETLNPEAAVGDFAADLVGTAVEDETGEQVKIVVENQLERTDHDHLGKVVTYAAHHEAAYAVWIAAEARPEHVKAVQWLNEHSDLTGWLFVIEAVAVDEDHVAPLLRRIVGPSVLSRTVRASTQADSVDAAAQLRFWTALLAEVSDRFAGRGLWQRHQPRKGVYLWQSVPGCPGEVGWQFWITTTGTWLCLRVHGQDTEEVSHYFGPLAEHREQIDAEFGDGLQWITKETMRANLLRWDNPRPGGYRDGPEKWHKAIPELVDAMDRLVEATWERLRAVPAYDPAEQTAAEPTTNLVGDDPAATAS